MNRERNRYIGIINWFRSILTGMVFIVFVNIFVILTCFGIYTYSVENAEKKEVLYASSERIGTRISNNLILPMWDFIHKYSVLRDISKKVALTIINDEMTDQNITAIIIRGNFGQIVIAKVRSETGELTDYIPESHKHLLTDSFYKKIKPIVSEGISIGSVEIYFTDKVMKRELFIILMAIIMQMLVLSSVTTSILYFALKREIVSPIRVLTEAITKTGDSKIDIRADINSRNELGALASAFNDMGQRLAGRDRELRESEEKYRAVVENANEAIIISKDERFVFVNRRSSELVGITPEDLLGRSFIDFIYQEDQALVTDYHKRRIAGEDVPPAYDFRIIGADGMIKWIFIKSSIIAWDGSPAVLSMLTEITKRKLAEEALKEKTEQLDRYFNSSLDLLCIADTSGYFIRLNPEWERVLGYSVAELQGRSFLDFVHPDDLESTRAALSILSRQEQIQNFENRYRCNDGSYRWIEWRSKPQANLIYCVARDVTKRRLAEEKLREMTTRLRVLSDNFPNGMLYQIEVKSDGSRRFTYVSAGVKEIHGVTPEEALVDPMTIYRTIVVENRAAFAEAENNSIKNFSEFKIETRIMHRNGDIKWVLITSAPRHGAEDSMLFDGIEIDISENKRAETEREKMQAQLSQAQKMESVGRLAGGVAHDFNNMLGVILGHTEIALKKMDKGDKFYLNMIEIQKAAKRSADLTRQLLAFARKQTVAPVVMDLNKTVSSLLNMLSRLIGEDIELTWLPGADIPPVMIDPSQIDQIMVNLCANARDAISGVGKITIETQNAVFDEKYSDKYVDYAPGSYVMLAVSDTGRGMDKDILSKVFEPFYTTKKAGKGTGLGLAMIYGIVTQNEGFINVYSEPGQGTTFKIYFPVHAEKSDEIAADVPHDAPGTGSETILLVEDEAMLLELARTMLEQAGYNILSASTPGEAIRIAEEYTGDIKMLVTDVIMPEMNGSDLAKQLLKIYPDIKSLFMSGYTASIIAHHGVLEQGVHFIQKPFSMKDLLLKVRKALDS